MTEILAFALIASLGMLVQSVVGFAGSLLAVPLFSLLMSPRDAVPGYAFLMLAVNGFLVCEGRRHIQWRSVRGLLLGGLPGVPIGALALKHLPTSIIGAAISIVTLLFGLLFLARVVNDANCLCLGEAAVTPELGCRMAEAFVNARFLDAADVPEAVRAFWREARDELMARGGEPAVRELEFLKTP